MMSLGWRRYGFTLIELLIVVAIIAILAAIAVPNFLEAQTRARVARIKSDFRSLATAIESYHTDWDNYPRPCYDNGIINQYDTGWAPGYGGWLGEVLTTPISYMGYALLTDPFNPPDEGDYYHYYAFNLDGQSVNYAAYAYYIWPYRGVQVAGNGALITPANPSTPVISMWVLRSVGPNRASSTYALCHYTDPVSLTKDQSNGPGVFAWDDYWVMNGIPGDDPMPANRIVSQVYDSSNGTKSFGEIFRVGGSKGGVGNVGTYFTNFFEATSN